MVNQFRDQYRFLSNFYPCSITVRDLTFNSAEACFQAAKCANPEDRKLFVGIDPAKAKALGKKIDMRKDWNEARIEVMYRILKLKFKNPVLREKLLATGYGELIEGNYWNDTFWGVDLRTGKGQNNLGKLLMRVREELTA